jgi:hypothetical protein
LSGVGLFVASKKLKPEELKKIMITQLEKAIPNSKVKTTALDFSIGFNSSVDIQGVDITYAGKRSYPLVAIKSLQLRIPFWSLLFGGGKVEVVLDSPKVNYIEFRKGSNWERALAKKGIKSTKSAPVDKQETKPGVKGGESSDTLVPAFLAGSEINISIINLNLEYALRDKTNGKIEVEKFLLKDVGIKSTTAFELKSKIDVLKKTPNHTSLDLLIIGEANLYEWVSKGGVTLNSKVNLRNIKSKKLLKEIKKLTLNSKTDYKKSGEYNVSYELMLEESQISKGVIKGSKKGITVDDLSVSLGLKEAAALVMDPATLPIKLSGKEKLNLNGKVLVGKNVVPLVKFNITPPLNISQSGVDVEANLSGETNHKGALIKAENKLLAGKINVDTHIKTNWSPKSFTNLKPIVVNVDVRDLQVKPDLLAASSKESSAKTSGAGNDANSKKKVKAKPVTVIAPIPLRARINLENIDLAGAKLKGGIKFKIGKTQASLASSGIKLDSGEINFKDTIRISRGQLRHDFDGSLKNINLRSLQGFVPKEVLEGLSGNASGNVRGHFVGEKYFAKVNMNLADGKLSKINLESYVTGLVDKLGSLGKKVPTNKLKVNGEFSRLSMKGSFDNRRHSFENFAFFAKDNKVTFTGNGNVYPTGGKESQMKMTLDIKERKLASTLNKEVGTTKFPLLVKGQGYAMSPDYGYTLKRITKKAAKTQIKKEAKKQLNKLLKGDKAKKLFKGLFK